MDNITVGLDFGTHQTKICIQRTADEGRGQSNYEFFKFKDLDGNDSYFLPSIMQINKDDTLSFGFVNPDNAKTHPDCSPYYGMINIDKYQLLVSESVFLIKC